MQILGRWKQDRSGKLATGAIANLVDEVGGAVIHDEGLPMSVSVDMSISYLSTAKLDVSELVHLNIHSEIGLHLGIFSRQL